jgi:hypothetical protein
MAFNDYSPSGEFAKFQELHGEDTFIKLNLLYIAFEFDELNNQTVDSNDFDELCEDILEISLDEAFESYNVIDIADAALFIIKDSNYSVGEYARTYKRNSIRVKEEILALLEKNIDLLG